MFGTLETSWREFRERDKEVSKQLMDYLSNFTKTGDPNGSKLPVWHKTDRNNKKVLCFTLKETKMGKPSYLKLIRNMFQRGVPKA